MSYVYEKKRNLMFDFSRLVKNYLTKDVFYEMSLSKDNHLDEIDFDEIYNCIKSGFRIY